jgi:hypothetical protein
MEAWKIYERMIAQLLVEQVSTGLCITPNARMMGSRSGVLRQVDVLIEPRHTPDLLHRSIVEAKRIDRKVHVKDVEALLGMMDDVDARHGYLVCPSGFSDAALRRAHETVRICLVPLDRIADFDPTEWPACLAPCRGGRIFWDGFPQVEMTAVQVGDPADSVRLLAFPQKVGKCDVCGAFHVHCLGCRDTLLVPHDAGEDDSGHRCSCRLPWFWLGSVEPDELGRQSAELHLILGARDIATVNRRPL